VNRLELVSAIAEKANLNRADAEKALAAFIDVVTTTLQKGDKVAIVGFGSFESSERAAREGINPATREKISIAASRQPKFKAGKQFKEAVQKRS
jgi:DNA-binding protein HU-beta